MMRTFLIAIAALAGLAGGAAQAQVVTGGGGVHGYPTPGPGWGGGYVGGQWSAGTNAPGGWNAYRRPHRGWRMPGYWRSPDYRIHNYAAFGLQAPPQGYGWSRYYDDAVLADYDGQVYDSVAGIDWRRVDQPYASGYGYPSQGYWNSPNGDGYAGDGYAYTYAQGGQGGQGYASAPQSYYQQSYGYQGGYLPGATATATFEFDRAQPETVTTTTTTTEWSEPAATRTIYRRGPTKVVYRTIVKKVPVYRAPVKRWRPKPAPRCADPCECGTVCGS